MKIKNLSKKTIIIDNAVEAVSLKEKIFGLILYKKPVGMIIHTRFGIHTFLMKYPIDVLVINKDNRVMAMKNKLKTNRIYIWNPAYSIIIELPPGSIESSGTTIGDYLLI